MTREEIDLIARALRSSRPGWSPTSDASGRFQQVHRQWQDAVSFVGRAIQQSNPSTFDFDRWHDLTGYHDALND